MGIWGVASISMGICTSYSSALVVRLISNACEVAFLPCALYYISTFYSRDQLALRLGVFWSFRYLADSIRDVLTYQVEDVDNRWNWMCISQGAPCILLALISLWQLPNDISDVNFLTERQRTIICQRIENDIGILNFDDWSWEQAGSVFTNLKTYAYIIVSNFSFLITQASTVFLLIVIREADVVSSDQRALFIVIPFILVAIITIVLCYVSGYRRDASQFILMLGIISTVILITLISMPLATSHDRYMMSCGLFVIVSAGRVLVVIWTISNFAGMTRRAIAIGATISFGFVGSVIGNQFFHGKEGDNSTKLDRLILLLDRWSGI
ncbi:major facilitator superfamily domain-containing protein [Choanephora cucurbitarum]|nr:major facilitator superfamily domain-containing protein [Choanephora cucurbitarum]